MFTSPLRSVSLSVLLTISTVLVGCGGPAAPADPVLVDGSGTLYPISNAVVAQYLRANEGLPVTLGRSTTGAGLQRFCAGELDIANASRHITADEAALCAEAGIEFIEMPVAYDAICVVVNRANTWADAMTTAELQAIWEPAAEGRVMRWSQVRDGWPDEAIHLVGPDSQSGTFDYFTEAIVGEPKSSRSDYAALVDDLEIVNAVEADPHALGLVGFTYYAGESERLRAVAIDDMDQVVAPGAIAPTLDQVRRHMYQPLSRPLFMYVRASSLERREVARFVDYYARFVPEVAERIGGVRLNRFEAELAHQRVINRSLGTMFADSAEGEMTLHMRLVQQQQQP